MEPKEMGPTCTARTRKWLTSSCTALYFTYFLSKWGDRMWSFSCGLFLVYLNDGLQLTAIYGFSSGCAMLLFGGFIGTWVDRSKRINAVQIALVVQNFSVALCAVAVCLTLIYEVPMKSLLNGNFHHITHGVIITLAVVGNLASMGYSIAIEKDWVVVLARGDKSKLANLNAATRTISLACQILAPTFVGIVMTYASLLVAAIIIAAWNVCSVAGEYAMLHRVYNLEPRLAIKCDGAGKEQEADVASLEPVKASIDNQETQTIPGEGNDEDNEADKSTGLISEQNIETEASEILDKKSSMKKGISKHMVVRLITGWGVYFRQSVVPAGLALALLYITVMGFDSVTIGYIYKNGISEMLVAICSAIAGLAGIFGTFLFVQMNRRIGLERTGLVAYQLEVACLVLAVVSVWAPGSLFNPYLKSSDQKVVSNCSESASLSLGVNNSMTSQVRGNNTAESGLVECDKELNISVILFIIGIVTSRIGLWMADLVVTQILQENVIEAERGVVGGIQSALNMLMDMIKFAIIIGRPEIHFFGIHIIWCFCCICLAGCLFTFHSWRVRGHLFHFDKIQKCAGGKRYKKEEINVVEVEAAIEVT